MGFLIVEGAVVVACGVGSVRLLKRRHRFRDAKRKQEWLQQVKTTKATAQDSPTADVNKGQVPKDLDNDDDDDYVEWKTLSEWKKELQPKKKKNQAPQRELTESQEAFRARVQAKLLHFTMLRVHSGVSGKLVEMVLEVTSLGLSHSQTVAKQQQQQLKGTKNNKSGVNLPRLLNTSSAIALTYRFDTKKSQRQQFAFLRRKATDELTDLLIPTLLEMKQRQLQKEQKRQKNKKWLGSKKTDEYNEDDDEPSMITSLAQDLKDLMVSQKDHIHNLLDQKLQDILFRASASVDKGLDHVQAKAQATIQEARLEEIQQLALAAASSPMKSLPSSSSTSMLAMIPSAEKQAYAQRAKAALSEANLDDLAQPLISGGVTESIQQVLHRGVNAAQQQPLIPPTLRDTQDIDKQAEDGALSIGNGNYDEGVEKRVLDLVQNARDSITDQVARHSKDILEEKKVDPELEKRPTTGNFSIIEPSIATGRVRVASPKDGESTENPDFIATSNEPVFQEDEEEEEATMDANQFQKESKFIFQERGNDENGEITTISEVVQSAATSMTSSIVAGNQALLSQHTNVLTRPLNETSTESLEKAHAALKQTKDALIETFQKEVKELVAMEMDGLFEKIMKALDSIVFLIDKSLSKILRKQNRLGMDIDRVLENEEDIQELKNDVYSLIDQSHHDLVAHISDQVKTFVDMMGGLLGLEQLDRGLQEDEEDDDDSENEDDTNDLPPVGDLMSLKV